MLNFIIHLLAAMVIGTLALLYYKERSDHGSTRRSGARLVSNLHKKLDESRKACAAWEQGIDDQQELYEQQMLSLNEEITAKQIKIDILDADLRGAQRLNYIHQTHCLPILDIDELLAETGDMEEMPAEDEPGGYILRPMGADVIDIENLPLVHDHNSTDKCGDYGCTTDRYVDGKHVFWDQTIHTFPETSGEHKGVPAEAGE